MTVKDSFVIGDVVRQRQQQRLRRAGGFVTPSHCSCRCEPLLRSAAFLKKGDIAFFWPMGAATVERRNCAAAG